MLDTLPGTLYYESCIFVIFETSVTMLHGEEQTVMALLKLKRAAQITIPADLRKKFNLHEGDYLEAEAVEGGILLKPVTVMERKQAGDELLKLLDRVHAKLPPSDKSPKEQEEEITRIIKEMRKEDAAKRRS